MSWKKWIVALSTVVCSTQFAPANASDCYDCDSGSDCGFNFCDCDPCEGWSIYADYLYWRVRRCDLDYAFSWDDSDEFDSAYRKHSVCPTYDSGVRAGILKACDDWDFGVHYTYFKSKNSNSVGSPVAPDAIGQTQLEDLINVEDINYASGTYRVELNQVDVEMGYHLEMSDCLAARLFTGFRYASINQKFDAWYAENEQDRDGADTGNGVDKLHLQTNLDFYGLYMGGKAGYQICDCFDFFGGFGIGLGVGEIEQKYSHNSQFGGDEENYLEYNHFHDDCWKSIAVLDLNVGITFPLCDVCCTDWALSLGYEFHHWFNLSSFESIWREDANDGQFDSHCCDLGFDGLFVRLSAAF